MHDTFEEILTGMGAIILGKKPDESTSVWTCMLQGRIIHEVGTTRMGDNPKTSVLNKFSHSHMNVKICL
jgi:choline dehydrogenase-like flavoprotein